MEDEFIDEDRVPLIDRYENNDDSVYEDTQTTSFTQEDEQQQQELDVEINALERGFNVKIPPEERGRFMRSSGYLQVEKSPGEFLNITKSNGEVLAASTMHTRLGASLARELLGIETPSSVRSREHGLTITAVLTSLGLVISTLVTSLTGGGAAGGSLTPPKNPSRVGEWVKSKLKALARLLGRLAGMAAAALPGIIGSIVAGLLNFLKKVVTAAAGHVWLFFTSVATLLGYRLMYPPNSKKR